MILFVFWPLSGRSWPRDPLQRIGLDVIVSFRLGCNVCDAFNPFVVVWGGLGRPWGALDGLGWSWVALS